ncbi:hypothetical protein P5E81_14990, partial [Clostridium perfringens]|nr:hypothetical protein [Clostridium perfringens]
MTEFTKRMKARWIAVGVLGALLAVSAVAFSLTTPRAAVPLNNAIPTPVLPAVTGVEHAQLTSPPWVPAPITRKHATRVVVEL